jgi:hypothetical protein
MKKTCIFEDIMRIWLEIGGTTALAERQRDERRRTTEKDKDEEEEEGRQEEQDEEIEEMAMRQYPENMKCEGWQQMVRAAVRQQKMGRMMGRQAQKTERRRRRVEREKRWKREREEEEGEEVGVRVEDEWVKVEDISARQVYDILIEKRFKLKKKDDKVNQAMTQMTGQLSADERQFWWEVAHKRIHTNNRLHKWSVDESGAKMMNTCPVCRGGIETWTHYEYDCDGVRTWLKRLQEVQREFEDGELEQDAADRQWTVPTVQEWRLEEDTEMSNSRRLVVAKARWLYHRERTALNCRRRRQLDYDVMVERLRAELELMKKKRERDEGERRKREDGKEKRKEKAKKKNDNNNEDDKKNKEKKRKKKKRKKRKRRD